jgi:hypothetical protein
MTRKHKRASLAVPVRVSRRVPEGISTSQMACTLDVTAEGARLNGVYSIQAPGEVIAVERGKNKALFRVIWIGERGTAQAGQVGVQCIEPDKNIWDVNFVPEADEPYSALNATKLHVQGKGEKGRSKRLVCSGQVELSNGHHGAALVHGHVTEVSGDGCYVRASVALPPHSRVSMKLRLYHAEVHLKGVVRASDKGMGMWVEFHAIRQGDLEPLQRVLDQLAVRH